MTKKPHSSQNPHPLQGPHSPQDSGSLRTSHLPQNPTVFIIEDDLIMAECYERVIKKIKNAKILTFTDAISAAQALSDTTPDLIILDVLLNGPDGFTLLNDFISYSDTAKIPVIIITSLNLKSQDLSAYGVIKVLSKDTLTPDELEAAVDRALPAAAHEAPPVAIRDALHKTPQENFHAL